MDIEAAKRNFEKYVDSHRSKVADNAKKLYDNNFIDYEIYQDIATNHDLSKYEEPEFTPYSRQQELFSLYGKDARNYIDDEIRDAVTHHFKNNPHHPEYWSKEFKRFGEKITMHVNNMPERYVIEMVCDWTAMGSQNGNCAREWYEKVGKRRWIFDKATADLTDKWLGNLESCN